MTPEPIRIPFSILTDKKYPDSPALTECQALYGGIPIPISVEVFRECMDLAKDSAGLDESQLSFFQEVYQATLTPRPNAVQQNASSSEIRLDSETNRRVAFNFKYLLVRIKSAEKEIRELAEKFEFVSNRNTSKIQELVVAECGYKAHLSQHDFKIAEVHSPIAELRADSLGERGEGYYRIVETMIQLDDSFKAITKRINRLEEKPTKMKQREGKGATRKSKEPPTIPAKRKHSYSDDAYEVQSRKRTRSLSSTLRAATAERKLKIGRARCVPFR